MTWDEFKAQTMPLAVQLGTQWDLPTWKLYHRAVQDISMPVFLATIDRISREWRSGSFPQSGKFREFAEAARKALIAAHPWEPCASCEDQPGWVELTTDGIKRLTRCGCVRAHRAKLDGLGVTKEPLSLPPARDFTAVGED
jgi:hypothetical protein